MKNLSKQIKIYRRGNGWVQDKLANEAGLSFNTITKLEQGHSLHPTIQTVEKLADAFDITIDELIGRNSKN